VHLNDIRIQKELIDYLSNLISENRRAKFDEVLNYRTRHITIVLEDLYQPHNASAVLRSCDIFGIQDIHVIENKNEYTIARDIALGSPKWLNIHKYNDSENNTVNCINTLKKKGYRIVATSPHKNGCSIEELSVEKPLALIFGTELTGISDIVREHADEFVTIPMFGFTESFNISVSAALCLHTLTAKLHQSTANWHLSELDKQELLLTWLRNSIRRVELIERDFIEKRM
jgi:tRNA (guanosine-2'-O-)-methyltransferase